MNVRTIPTQNKLPTRHKYYLYGQRGTNQNTKLIIIGHRGANHFTNNLKLKINIIEMNIGEILC